MKILRKITRYLLCVDDSDVIFIFVIALIVSFIFDIMPLSVLFGGLVLGLLFEVNDKTFKRFFTNQVRLFGTELLKVDKDSFMVNKREISDWVLFNYGLHEYTMFQVPYSWQIEEKVKEKYRDSTIGTANEIYVISAANKELATLFKIKWG